MNETLHQLQQLQVTFAQLQASLTAQQHHLSLLIHLLQQENNTATSNAFAQQSINNFISSYQGIVEAFNKAAHGNSIIENATKELTYSYNDIAKQEKHTAYSNNDKEKETKQTTYSNDDKAKEIKHTTYSNDDKAMETKQVTYSNDDKAKETKQTTYSNDDKGFDVNNLNHSLFKQKLVALMPNCTQDTVQNALKVIICLYKHPKQSYKALMQLTQLSKGGLAKHIMMLKKRNFIFRLSYQEYQPTAFALGLMRECMGE